MLALHPRVVDAVWTAVQAHLPPPPPDTHPLGCHRPRISDRDCFHGMLVRLITGCSWDVAARLTPASETTLRNRRTEWLAAGVFDTVLEEAIAGYDRIIGLDLSEVAVDGSLHKGRPAAATAPARTPPTGPRPAGSGRSPPTASASRWAGPPTAPTGTTASCSNPPCKPSPTAGCSATSAPCTSTAATTAR